MAVVGLDDGYAVVRLDSVVDGELSDEDHLRKQAYARRIANASGNTEMLGFLRLLRAHQSLLAGEGSVTDVALKWGFTHFGRFSISYREKFGFSPRDTLRASHGSE